MRPTPPTTKTITVTGNGSVTTVPDRAGFDFTVETQAATAKAALAQNADAAAAVIAALKNAGIDAADIQTSQVSLSPQTNQDGTEIVGYAASTTVSVKTTIAKAGSLVDAAVGAGADGVSGPNLSLSDQDAQYRAALKNAVADAHAKAQALAARRRARARRRADDRRGRGAVPRSRSRQKADVAAGVADRAGHADGRRHRHRHLRRVLASRARPAGPLRPLAPRAGIELPLPAVERCAMEDDARSDAGAAVGDELTVGQLRQRLGPRRVQRAGDPARRIVDRVRLAAPAVRRPRVDERRDGSAEPAGDLVCRDRVAGALARHEPGRLDLLVAGAKRAAPGVETADEHAAVVVAEVPEQPPEPLGPAQRPVRDDEHARPDARARGRGGESSAEGSGWRPASGTERSERSSSTSRNEAPGMCPAR